MLTRLVFSYLILHKKPTKKIYKLSTGALSHCSGKSNGKDKCRVHSSVSFCPRVPYKIHSDLTSRRPLIPGLSFLRILSSQIWLCSLTMYPEQTRRGLAIHKVFPRILAYLKRPHSVCNGGSHGTSQCGTRAAVHTAQEHQQMH